MKKPQICLLIQGGLIQHIVSNCHVDVAIIDLDDRDNGDQDYVQLRNEDVSMVSPLHRYYSSDDYKTQHISDKLKEIGL